MNILLTAIGSMSAEAVIKSLKKKNHYLVGTDIYPKEWTITSSFVDKFYNVPLYNDINYINKLLEICRENDITYLIPLTDPEIDRIILKRNLFEKENIKVCLPENDSITIARDKLKIYETFKGVNLFNVIPTFTRIEEKLKELNCTIIAKPRNGRSSEGLFRISSNNDMSIFKIDNTYIFQPEIKGTVITIDTIRDKYNNIVSVARQELKRTVNGAGVVVKLIYDEKIFKISEFIIERLGIIGCINIELISSINKYYLLDINPRFSAGLAFSEIAGYDFVNNHLNCFNGLSIEKQIKYDEIFISKRYIEIIHNN